jgi:hypothetical protein
MVIWRRRGSGAQSRTESPRVAGIRPRRACEGIASIDNEHHPTSSSLRSLATVVCACQEKAADGTRWALALGVISYDGASMTVLIICLISFSVLS